MHRLALFQIGNLMHARRFRVIGEPDLPQPKLKLYWFLTKNLIRNFGAGRDYEYEVLVVRMVTSRLSGGQCHIFK